MKKLSLILTCCYVATFASGAVFQTIFNSSQRPVVYRKFLNGVYNNSLVTTVQPGQSMTDQTDGYAAGTIVSYSDTEETGVRIYAIPVAGVNKDVPSYFTYFGTNGCSTFNKTLCFTNRTGGALYGVWKKNGVEVHTEVVMNNGVGCYTASLTVCTNGSSDIFQVGYLVTESDVVMLGDQLTYSPPAETVANTASLTNNTTTNITATSVSSTNLVPTTTWSSITNSVIDFTGTSTTAAKDDTLKAGFNKLSQDLKLLKDTVNLSVIATMHQGSNTAGSGTDMSGVISAIDSFHHDNTNLLGQLTSTNVGDLGAGGNATAAQSEADSATATLRSTMDGNLTGIGTAPEILTGGDATFMTFSMAGHEINLDPEVRVPGAMGMVKKMTTLAVLLIFGLSMAKLYFATMQTFATAQTGGVPNLALINLPGIAVALAIPVIFIGLWVVAFDAFFSYAIGTGDTIQSLMGSMGSTATSISVSNPITLYLLNGTLPVSLILSCAWTRVAATFFMSKLILVSASASRFLFGK